MARELFSSAENLYVHHCELKLAICGEKSKALRVSRISSGYSEVMNQGNHNVLSSMCDQKTRFSFFGNDVGWHLDRFCHEVRPMVAQIYTPHVVHETFFNLMGAGTIMLHTIQLLYRDWEKRYSASKCSPIHLRTPCKPRTRPR